MSGVQLLQDESVQTSWLISGGVGALGGLMASWLAQSGCGELTLLGRSGRLQSQDTEVVQRLFCSHQSIIATRWASHA